MTKREHNLSDTRCGCCGYMTYEREHSGCIRAAHQAPDVRIRTSAPSAWASAIMEQAQVFASAWALVGGPFDSGNALECAEQAKAELRAMLSHPHPTENLRCKSTQKRLATLWGYEKARQPLTEEQIKAAVRHLYGSDAIAAMAVTGDIETARVIEAAHGIGSTHG